MHENDVCDVCTRTLLRGEQTEMFVGGGRRYNVCELCKPHALHEGWMREGAIPDFQGRQRACAAAPLAVRPPSRQGTVHERGDELQLAVRAAHARR